MKPKQKKPYQQELTKRAAAAMAHATSGRARIIESKKIYNRAKGKILGSDRFTCPSYRPFEIWYFGRYQEPTAVSVAAVADSWTS